jgi:hypothetical protein
MDTEAASSSSQKVSQCSNYKQTQKHILLGFWIIIYCYCENTFKAFQYGHPQSLFKVETLYVQTHKSHMYK